MESIVRIFNMIAKAGGFIGLIFAGLGAYDFFIGLSRDDDVKKDKGVMKMVIGAMIGSILYFIFSTVASGIQSLTP